MAAPRTTRLLRFGLGLLTLAAVSWGTVEVLDTLAQGPDAQRFPLHVLLKDAHGLRRGSHVRYRGMVVGDVASMELDATSSRVRVQLRIEPDVATVLTSTTEFWVVHPRFRGLRRGLYGLDTLIKESYVRMRDRPGGETLSRGEELLGRETPPDDLAEGELEDAAVGDLIARLVLPDSGGLEPGSPILFRGIQSGEVRRVQLSSDGRGIVLTFRIFANYRFTVRDTSRFWVSRPVLRGSLMSGFSVEELSSLLAVSLSYDMPEGSEPAEDGARFVALVEPPREAEEWEGAKVDPGNTSADPRPKIDPDLPRLSPLVRVRYRAIERDFWSANDTIRREGDGVLYLGPRGGLYVITRRSACDARYFVEGHWYDGVHLEKERIRVVLGDGRVWPARIRWKGGADLDLAVLAVQAAGGGAQLMLPDGRTYLRFDAEPGELPQRSKEAEAGEELFAKEGRYFGILGFGPGPKGKPQSISFAKVPELFRPQAEFELETGGTDGEGKAGGEKGGAGKPGQESSK
jgi:hypothetical protein